MKKLFLAFVFAVLSLGLFAQNQYVPVYVVADSSINFTRVLEVGTPVYCVSLNQMIFTKVKVGKVGSYDFNWLLASASRYTTPDFTSPTSFTTENATIQDTAFVGGGLNYIIEANTNTLGVPNSWKVADTSFIGSANYIWQNTVNGLKVPNSITAVDTVFGARVYGVSELIVGTQTIASSANRATFNNSVVATDSLLGAQTTVSGTATSLYNVLTTTDTVTDAPVGSIQFKISDSSLYVKIRATGTKHARWIKFSRTVMP